MLLRDLNHLPLHPQQQGHFWWPWLRNYYGEKTSADAHCVQILSYAWVDQSMKKEMGF
jgi:hypothetical protein